MKHITIDDLEALGLGAAILGSGGGGAPSYNRLITQHLIEKKGPVPLLSVDDLAADDLVVPLAFMGAPLVALEKIPSGREIEAIMTAIRKSYGRMPSVLMPAEIGGANAFTPIFAAAALGLPVLDADTIGRAFPELQMSTCTLHQISCAPAFLADSLGNHLELCAQNSHDLERMARAAAVAMGSRAACALYLMDGASAQKTVVSGSIRHAIAIGKALLAAQKERRDPVDAVVNPFHGTKLASGIVSDIDQKIEGGFSKGKAILTCENGERIALRFQNEYLLAERGQERLAATPDILMLLEQEKGTPITTASLKYGLRADLIVLPSPPIWKTAEGLRLVGPKYFGYGE
jgi:DUF917 family protein